MPARSLEPEILDRETPPRELLDRCYGFMKWVNRRLGGVRATLSCFERFAEGWRPGETVRVLDVAAGAADVPAALARWARRRGFDLRVTVLDLEPGALDFARRDAGPVRPAQDRSDGAGEPEMSFLCADVGRMPCRDGAFDYVTTSMFFHHLTDEQIVGALRAFDRIARRGIVVNDLVRRLRAWIWIKLFTLWANPIVKVDGPLSVRKSLTPREAEELVRRADLPYLSVRTHFGHRLTLSGEKIRP
ncbi:MAG: methyltransferase domain-containing protein [Planctomycetes bacterium]|nr:methyltransferase domain-containing protein [Planctomycetota bacterium]